MADVTPIYGFPFLELGDPPDLASGTENLALAVEAQIVKMDTAVKLTRIIASGNFVKNVSPPPKWVRFRGSGAGGTGGGAAATVAGQHSKGAGGGAGGDFDCILPGASVPASVTVTIGAVGAPTTGGGVDGGNTTVDLATDLVGLGGKGGGTTASAATAFGATPGEGGDATGPTSASLRGGDAGTMGFGSGALGSSGTGGGNRLGSGGVGRSSGTTTSQAGGPARGFGGGGGGGLSNNGGAAALGGTATPGVVYVEEYF